ncbi:hypothetical protein E2C01_099781 [Portunus trituberculatus]|uniref:Uncharacterized protein n=1 Tax=Portunus trituberculatus TaxID=210409 RepID=A0A5B7KAF9_PORTR|nr:hypothetical protein [Portunus trituberculatus]
MNDISRPHKIICIRDVNCKAKQVTRSSRGGGMFGVWRRVIPSCVPSRLATRLGEPKACHCGTQ